jgi:hypothetical protein
MYPPCQRHGPRKIPAGPPVSRGRTRRGRFLAFSLAVDACRGRRRPREEIDSTRRTWSTNLFSISSSGTIWRRSPCYCLGLGLSRFGGRDTRHSPPIPLPLPKPVLQGSFAEAVFDRRERKREGGREGGGDGRGGSGGGADGEALVGGGLRGGRRPGRLR